MAEEMIRTMASSARDAARALAQFPAQRKAEALLAAAEAMRADAAAILSANAADVDAARQAGLAPAMIDRLMLDTARLAVVADGVAAVAMLSDPVGRMVSQHRRPNGLSLQRIGIPIGVLAIIYESRPNVTADAAALCFKSGNAAILRGGSEASRSNAAIHAAIVRGLDRAGAPRDAIQLVSTTDRSAVGALLAAEGLVDMVVPRGGKSLVARVQAEARVPVLAHLDGVNHVYVDRSADPGKALAIVLNSKLRRTAVCGAMETLLIDRAYPDAAALIAALIDAGCALYGDEAVCALDARVASASQADWGKEYLDAVASAAMVDGVAGAIAHIEHYGSHHTDCIVAEDGAAAARFLAEIDSAIVMHNASTQFADGAEFGLGAEIGIATGRLHARGPVALEGLTTYKWLVHGNGQIRA